MPCHVCNGAITMCTFGVAPATFNVLPIHRMITSDQPAANINDFAPMVNVMPHGMCITPSNPEVAAATAAAMGVLTPVPCMPVTTAPWTPGAVAPPVMLDGAFVLDDISILMCAWGGVITFTFPGEVTEMVP
jgi:Domain of unknown function (DUF4280)